ARCSTRASSSSGRSTSPRNLRPTPQCPRSPDDSQSTGFDYYSEMPHGGFKQSGYGKDMSIYALEEYTRIKHVMTKTN
ncbi:aldehyde dehydrogenase family protein, partial [Nocardia farcinica]|nr:aldehyde dehydrogenase family protein [Nocardia farcinica]